MSATITIDTTSFNRAVRDLIARGNKEPHEVMRQQMRLLVQRLVELTQPHHGRGTAVAAKKQGENAILRDLMGGGHRPGIFFTADESFLRNKPSANTVRLFAKKDGTVYGVDRNLFQPRASGSQLEEHHRTYFKNGRMTKAGGRTRDIGRWRFIDKMVVGKNRLKRFIKQLQSHVGRAKGGWNHAAARFGYKPPPWVSRHSSADGDSAEIKTNRGGVFIAINRNKSIGTINARTRIVENAMRGRERDMRKSLDLWLQREARKFSRL